MKAFLKRKNQIHVVSMAALLGLCVSYNAAIASPHSKTEVQVPPPATEDLFADADVEPFEVDDSSDTTSLPTPADPNKEPASDDKPVVPDETGGMDAYDSSWESEE